MKSRFLGIILCITLSMSLFACGKKDSGDDDINATEQEAVSEKETEEDTDEGKDSSTEDTDSDTDESASSDLPQYYISKHFDANYDGDSHRGDHRYSFLRLSPEYADLHSALAKRIKKMNNEIADAEQSQLQTEEDAIEDWLGQGYDYDPAPYEDEWNVYVTRSDEEYFSVLVEARQESLVGDFTDIRYTGYTWHTDSGKVIEFEDILEDEDGFYDGLTDHILSQIRETTEDDQWTTGKLNTKLRELMEDGQMSFNLTPQGVQIWVDSYIFSPQSYGVFCFFGDDEDAALFTDEISGSMPDNWIMMPVKNHSTYIDADDDGSSEEFYVADRTDLQEYEGSESFYISGIYLSVDNDWKEIRTKADGGTEPYDVFLVHQDGKTTLMTFHYEYVYPYINTYKITKDKIKDVEEITAHFTFIPSDAADSEADLVAYYVPQDPTAIDITLVSDDDPDDETQTFMTLSPDGKLTDNGGSSKKSSKKDSEKDSGETESGDARYDAYDDVLSLYKMAQDKGYSEEQVKELGLETELVQHGWPSAASDDAVKYSYYDINSDDKDELVLTYYDSLIDIYGFDGKKTVLAYSCPYRAEAMLHSDGVLEEMYFPSMNYGSVTWYMFDGEVADLFPAIKEEYKKTDAGKDVYSYFKLPYATDRKADLISEYRKNGRPDWMYDKEEELTESGYSGLISDAKEISFKDAALLKDFNY